MSLQPPQAATEGSPSLVRTGDGQVAAVASPLMAPLHLGRGLPDAQRVAGERDLLAFVEAQLARGGCRITPLAIIDYYISLKTHRFVVLLGPRGEGKLELAHTFAATLVGPGSAQFAHIQVRPLAAGAAAQQSIVPGLYERFGWIKCIEFLEQAVAPGNAGKPYFLCLENLSPLDVETYFASLIQGDRPDERRLALPGYPPERWPIVPANLFICGTVNADEYSCRFSETVLGRVGPIEFWTARAGHCLAEVRVAGTPPMGLQRLLLAPTPADDLEALQRLQRWLATDVLEPMLPSPALQALLAEAEVRLDARTLENVRRYVANSFDQDGRGLFDTHDARRNYELALDFELARRALLQLRQQAPVERQQPLLRFLETLVDQLSDRAAAVAPDTSR